MNKTIDLTVQEKKEFCVCSVLQAIFRKNGVEISQEEIAGNLTPGDERGFKIHDEKIKRFMLKQGFEYTFFYSNETLFNEPDELLKEMCRYGGFIGISTHVYLLKDFKDPVVKLVDPKTGQEVEKDYSKLLREMKEDIDDGFGLVKRI